jgi:quinol---cytochrome c reductase iron-sulfur subunit, bacillus type
MNRRSLLKWISRAIGWTSALVVAIPGISFVTAPLRRRGAGATTQRIAKLNSLQTGVPTKVAITGDRQDAWVHYDEETIGRAWLVRETDDSANPEDAKVTAFSAVCPHLSCNVHFDTQNRFNCPCHKALFEVTGQPVPDAELGYRNPAPRGLDALQCKVVKDEDSGEWWVEVKYEDFEPGLTTQVPKV